MFGKPVTEQISKEEQFREVSKILAIALNRIHKAAKGKPIVPVEARVRANRGDAEAHTEQRR